MRVADRLDDAAAVDAVRTEYEVLRALDDPHIPRVQGFYQGQAALAVSWVGGVSLAELLEAARDHVIELDLATALDLAAEVAATLRVAHGTVARGQAIVHGHLDPTRVMLDRQGELSVVGFGVVRAVDRTGYTPPEQAAGQPPTPASDQWTVGALVVEMLLGRRLYEELDDPTTATLDGAVEPWVASVEAMTPSLGRTLRKMLAPQPEERLASDGEVVQALLAAERESGGVSGRGSVVAAVLQRRALVAAARELEPVPMPMPDTRIMISLVRPSQEITEDTSSSEDEALPPSAEADEPSDDPFPDSPTSPDGYGRLADALFSDEVTDPDRSTGAEEAELHDGSPTVSEPAPADAPTGRTPSGLQSTERVGLALAVVLGALAIFFVLSWVL